MSDQSSMEKIGNMQKQLLKGFQNESTTFENLMAQVTLINSNIVARLDHKSIEQSCVQPVDAKKKEIIKTMSSQLTDKAEKIIYRQVNKLMQSFEIQQTMKTCDYIIERANAFKDGKTEFGEIYDEEEIFMDQFKEYLEDYYKKL